MKICCFTIVQACCGLGMGENRLIPVGRCGAVLLKAVNKLNYHCQMQYGLEMRSTFFLTPGLTACHNQVVSR